MADEYTPPITTPRPGFSSQNATTRRRALVRGRGRVRGRGVDKGRSAGRDRVDTGNPWAVMDDHVVDNGDADADIPDEDERLVLSWKHRSNDVKYKNLWGNNEQSLKDNEDGFETNGEIMSKIRQAGLSQRQAVINRIELYASGRGRGKKRPDLTDRPPPRQPPQQVEPPPETDYGTPLQSSSVATSRVREEHKYFSIDPDTTDTGFVSPLLQPPGGSLYFGSPSAHKPVTHTAPTPLPPIPQPRLPQPQRNLPTTSPVCLIHKPEMFYSDVEALAAQPYKPFHPFCQSDSDRKFCLANLDYQSIEIQLRSLALTDSRSWQLQFLETKLQSWLTYYQVPTDPPKISEEEDERRKREKSEKEREQDVARAVRLQTMADKQRKEIDDDERIDPNDWSVVHNKMNEIREKQRLASKSKDKKNAVQEPRSSKGSWPRSNWHCWRFNRQTDINPDMFVILFIPPPSPTPPAGTVATKKQSASANIYKYVRCQCVDKSTVAQLAMLEQSLD